MGNVIFHIDVNSAFLSWTAVKMLKENPDAVDIRTVPSIIGGDESRRHGIVLAKSVPAKKYGIQTGEPLVNARQKCPDLLCVSPNYDDYVSSSRELMDLLKKYAPTVEQFSIDEAFCDMTGAGRLYGDPVAFAHKLKDEIYDTFGFTVNIGISSNKLLAKMASDFEKPNKVHTLFPEEIPQKMWPLDVGDLFFVGKNTKKKLNSLGIRTIGDLAQTDVSIIQYHLKKFGLTLWDYANGRDLAIVTDHDESNRSYSNETTVSHDITSPEIAKHILLSLCETVSARLRADKIKGRVVGVYLTNSDFEQTRHQITLPSATDVTQEIYTHCCKLFTKLWDGSPIRLLGVSCSKITEDDNLQYNLFDGQKYERLQKLDSAIDKVRNRYGDNSIMRACFLPPKDEEK